MTAIPPGTGAEPVEEEVARGPAVPVPPGQGDVTRGDVARGAALAALSRLGAVIEVVSQPAFTWLFGLPTYGVYVVLWAIVNIAENFIDLSMTTALQRVVPVEDEAGAHAAVRFALIVSVGPAAAIALAATIFAPQIAAMISAAPADRVDLPLAVALFAWALPLWTFVEVATSAVRARRAFGPEIRLRIFWEQVARLIFACGFFLIGFHRIGLLLGHLASLAMTAALAGRLIGRYYDARLVLTAPISASVRRDLLTSGLSVLPSSIARRLYIDLPPVILNIMLPGVRGADAAGLFGIARKISTIPLIVRQAFQYVLAPLASAAAARDRATIAPLYRFATRVSIALVVPLAGFIILIGADILTAFAPAAAAALPLVVILVLGRAAEAVVGPASPVVEMTGHKALPLVNSLLGMAAWLMLAVMLVPGFGGVGMAVAVSVGTVLSTWAAAVELRWSDQLSAFDRQSWTGLAVALAGIAAMALAGFMLEPLGMRLRALLLVPVFLAATWATLRLGLSRDDRLALGGVARRIRLV
ncbi:lipopolysaccharide biosynthesis protein [Sphingomonas quercus]|uniref:Lipopolysaccharide biosynthesis protein n=1 Tax=Sphingomonas quercus TaxID=2842451 RepID=A0ABS6BI54_9SPHN|nr:lipopolysaccharide biosynthesis protein [Sphingomonas quercus]MBU3077121.1 lipopolysaccharide biosynthesis protein [Sphingomonas quercus]